MQIEVSNGEIVDKFTILLIKKDKIKDEVKLANVIKELHQLEKIVAELDYKVTDLFKLMTVNFLLWGVEDALRELENKEDFGDDFVELARSVYKLNDTRAEIKRKINIDTNSELTEEKSYKL